MKKSLANLPTVDRIVGGLILFFIGLLGLSSLIRSFDHDEFEAIHTAWLILEGKAIYVDFFQHHHPFLYYLLLPFVGLFGETMYTPVLIRGLLFFSFTMGILWVTYRLSMLIFQSVRVGLLSVLFALSTNLFLAKAIEIRPDVPQTFFLVLSLYWLFKYLRFPKTILTLALSAASLAVSFLFLQKTILLQGGFAAAMIYLWWAKKIRFKDLLIYVAVYFAVLLPYFFYLLLTGSLETYWIFNWLINMSVENKFSPFDSLGHTSLILWIFYIIGLYQVFRRDPIFKSLGILSLLFLATIPLIKTPFRQYFLPLILPMCLISAYALSTIFDTRRKLFGFCIFILCLSPLSLFSLLPHQLNSKQLNKINYVLEQTRPSDLVYDGDIDINLFRHDINFFWYSVHPNKLRGVYERLKPYPYDIYQLIDRKKPKLIYMYEIDNLDHPVLQNYHQSPVYGDIYIRKSS